MSKRNGGSYGCSGGGDNVGVGNVDCISFFLT